MVFKLPKKEVMISSEIGKEVIKKELTLIPKLPGVYRMLNDKGDILYVGKAKNLPNRLKSYVAEKNHIIRTERMLSQTRKLEITTTSNESEALLLEANLIKKHKPKFNILLRDDKSFPAIYFSSNHDFPGIYLTRNKKLKGIKLGPYANVTAARQSTMATASPTRAIFAGGATSNRPARRFHLSTMRPSVFCLDSLKSTLY